MKKLIVLLLLCTFAVGSLPLSAQVGSVSIPIGTDSYKITVSEDGIYEVSYEDLQAAGMDVAAVNPNTFEMMHKGEPMAYQLIGNGDDIFDAGEAVRFFGWAFDGSNHDSWFVDENYYWLWANGLPTTVDARPSSPNGLIVDSWRSTLIFEENNHYSITLTDDWDGFEFEADAWFMARIATNPAGVDNSYGSWDTPNPEVDITPEMGQSFREYTVELFDPVSDGADATMTTEVFSLCSAPEVSEHLFAASLNGVQHIDQWEGRYGRSFNQQLPADSLVDGNNTLRYDGLTPPENITGRSNFFSNCGSSTFDSDFLLPNRSILQYDRRLAAVDDQLLFTYDQSGTHRFMVSDFTTGNVDSALVWDVTDPTMPSVITLSDSDIIADGGAFTWMIGDENFADGEYVATSVIKTPDNISQYVAPDLTQANVEWLGVSHANFLDEAERLGAYRNGVPTDVTLSDGSVVSVSVELPRVTQVVDVADVIAQYGYGYNLPQAIHAYFQDAYLNWSNGKLKYSVLVGDATINPRQLDCIEQCDRRGEWDASFETFVVTDMAFHDRFSGLAVTDHTYANLVDDGSSSGLNPEIAVGRFTVNTREEAHNVVDKIIVYEYNQQIEAAYLDNLIFFTDNADGGGDFCQSTRAITDEISDLTDNPFVVARDYVDEFSMFYAGNNPNSGAPYCLDEYMNDGDLPTTVAARLMRDDLFAEINSTGSAIVNYYGHGSRYRLGDGILDANRDVDDTFLSDNVGLFANNDQPILWISGNCLDGDFSFPSTRESALSERMLRLDGLTGIAGQWTSTGLGFDREQQALHQGFYEALYTPDENGEPRGAYMVGDAIIYSKVRYVDNELGNTAQVWAYTYQGDPGMAMPHATFVQALPDTPLALTLSTSETVQPTMWMVLLGAATILASVTVFNINRRTKLH